MNRPKYGKINSKINRKKYLKELSELYKEYPDLLILDTLLAIYSTNRLANSFGLKQQSVSHRRTRKRIPNKHREKIMKLFNPLIYKDEN